MGAQEYERVGRGTVGQKKKESSQEENGSDGIIKVPKNFTP
jgi:hypothetical protein